MIRKKVKHIYFKSFIDNADIINTHNYFTSYSEFFIKEKRETYTQEQLIELLASNGMLVKRPIVIQGDMIIIGNKVSEYEKLQK